MYFFPQYLHFILAIINIMSFVAGKFVVVYKATEMGF